MARQCRPAVFTALLVLAACGGAEGARAAIQANAAAATNGSTAALNEMNSVRATRPPTSAATLLAAVAAGDLAAARSTLAEDVNIVDARNRPFVASSLEAFAGHARGCDQGELVDWRNDGEDPNLGGFSVTWTCPSRGTMETMIWTVGARVAHITFGLPSLQQPSR